MSTTRSTRTGSIVRVAALIVLTAAFLLPAYWLIATALKPESETITLPLTLAPLHPTLENFKDVLADPSGNVLGWFVNSTITSTAQAAVHVVLCILAAYPLARLTFPGRDAWFWIILSTLMLPPVVLLVPRYVMMLELDWIDTYHPLIWVHVASAFGVFLLRQFFLGIPRDLEDAARLDGANILQVIRHVIVPASVPAIVTLFVFSFLFSWNDFLWPLFTVRGELETLPVGLSKFAGRYATEYGSLMAAAALAALPAVIGFFFAQRYIVQGVTLSGMKD